MIARTIQGRIVIVILSGIMLAGCGGDPEGQSESTAVEKSQTWESETIIAKETTGTEIKNNEKKEATKKEVAKKKGAKKKATQESSSKKNMPETDPSNKTSQDKKKSQDNKTSQDKKKSQDNKTSQDKKSQDKKTRQIKKGWLYYESCSSALPNSEKKKLDKMVKNWTQGQFSDGTLENKMCEYLQKQGRDMLTAGVAGRRKCLFESVKDIPDYRSQLKERSGIYNFIGLYTEGKYTSSGELICYYWEAGVM